MFILLELGVLGGKHGVLGGQRSLLPLELTTPLLQQASGIPFLCQLFFQLSTLASHRFLLLDQSVNRRGDTTDHSKQVRGRHELLDWGQRDGATVDAPKEKNRAGGGTRTSCGGVRGEVVTGATRATTGLRQTIELLNQEGKEIHGIYTCPEKLTTVMGS